MLFRLWIKINLDPVLVLDRISHLQDDVAHDHILDDEVEADQKIKKVRLKKIKKVCLISIRDQTVKETLFAGQKTFNTRFFIISEIDQ